MQAKDSLRPAASVRETLFAEDKVSPPDETALVTAVFFQFPALRDWITTQLGPKMTGPTKSKGRRGMKLQSAG